MRTTCGPGIGFGHLRRCLTLAAELTAADASPTFWLDSDERGRDIVSNAGFHVVMVGPDPAAMLTRAERGLTLLVDDYAVTGVTLAELHGAVAAVAVIDDLADRDLDVDLVINATMGAETLAYRTGPGCKLLLGPRYALLRPSFRALPPRQVTVDVRRVLVTLGGSDPHGLTTHVVHVVRRLLPNAIVDAVIGPLFDDDSALRQLRSDDGVVLHVSRPDLLPLMRQADVAVSGGGQTSYELAASGLPAVALCIAENQRPSLTALAAVPTLLATDVSGFPAALAQLIADEPLRRAMSACGQRLVDGLGARRAAREVETLAASARSR